MLNELFFLPDWPLAVTDLGWFGIMLLLALALGELAKHLRLPRISGYVVAGMLLSPQIIGELGAPDMFARLRPFFTVAFGLVLFELGQRIDLGWLRRNPWLLATSIAESLLAFTFTAALLLFIDVPTAVALLAASLACATGPAVILSVCQDTGARGQITERLHLLCALSSAYSFLALGVVYAWQHQAHASALVTSLLHPGYLIVASVVLGGLLAYVMRWLLARLDPSGGYQTAGAVALVIVTVAAVDMLNLSVVVTLLAAGTLTRSLDREKHLKPMDFGLLGRLALVVMFVASGALLQLEGMQAAIVPALGLIAARAAGKIVGVFIFAHRSGLSKRKASLLSIGLLPMTGAALLWVEQTTRVWPELGPPLAAIVLTALLIMELLAPPALQFALRKADESREET